MTLLELLNLTFEREHGPNRDSNVKFAPLVISKGSHLPRLVIRPSRPVEARPAMAGPGLNLER